MRFFVTALAVFTTASIAADVPDYAHLDEAPHFYSQRPLQDPFTRLETEVESGRVGLDSAGSLTLLKSLLTALNVPAESQLLVFSTTSLQLSLISPGNPRAIYFNEEVYVGYIPGGKIEVIALDPALGAIFYIFPIPRPGEKIRPERSDRCMNCHSVAESRYVPGLVIQSVVPAPSGGTLDSFRKEETGHQIPYEQRLGGWYVTGAGALTNHWGNLIGRMHDGEISKQMLEPSARFDSSKYLMPGSDALGHLLLEHQAGFINRVVEATYRTRTLLALNGGQLTPGQSEELDRLASELVRYILFADEPPLPKGAVNGDVPLKQAFLRNRRVASNGSSLKDLDLHEHLLSNRCSYMVYSGVFTALPPLIKDRIFRELDTRLGETDTKYVHLPPEEKRRIRLILRETIPNLPASF